uniref:Natriuretic peptide B n=1 Tax=Molossus molossus TaxID=27622 RepID=A0A7J8FAP6_MOLMO|nr:natriuretic peptide B [Molossus molossus]
MDPQMGLPWALLLLLFVGLLPLGGSSPDPALELSGAQDLLPGETLELKKDQMALESLQKRDHFTKAWEARRAASAAGLGSPNPKGPKPPKKKPPSRCFGGKIDPIGRPSGRGCNVLKKKKKKGKP